MTINALTKYYYHGGQRVAMRQGDGVYYLSGDHLGSTSLTTDSSGQVVHQARYLPYGAERWSSGAGVTDYTFTGQRVEAGFGLYDYNARFYSARLGRFVSADVVVPNPANPQNFNRYGYTTNNPVRYTDPSGHCVVICLGIGIALTVAVIFFYNEMPVGEGAPAHTPVKNYVKSGTDVVGDTYALVDEYPDNIIPNAAAILLPFVSHAMVKGGVRVFELYHGTKFSESVFESGIDAAQGGGQLGPGFYVTPNRDAAEWFAKVWPGGGTDSSKLLKLTIPEDELSKLKIKQLTSEEFDALTDVWGSDIPPQYQYLIDDYDALLAPLDNMGWQLKFNPRAQEFLNKYVPDFEKLSD